MTKEQTAKQTIEKALASSKSPWILSSFGKDSLAVLDLCSYYGVRRVLYLEDRDEIVDADHIARTIECYKLMVMRMNSGRAVLYFIGSQPYLLGFPFVNERVMIPIPTNVDPYAEGEPFTCVDDRLRAYYGTILPSGADLFVDGFKLVDWETNTCRVTVDRFDPKTKAEQLARYTSIQELAPDARICHPLLDWSHEDVWSYLEAHCIGTSPLMYDGRAKRPHLNRICYRCHDPFGPTIVECPKVGRVIMNLSAFTKDSDLGIEQLKRLAVLGSDEADVLRAQGKPNG